MTVVWEFVKNPKNLIIVILLIIALVASGAVLWQRASLASKEAKIATLAKDIEIYRSNEKEMQKRFLEYADQIIKMKKVIADHQTITNATAKEVVKIKYVKSDCKIGGDDAKIINSSIVTYFNTGLLRE
jgi:hypothetical protein